MAQKTIIQLTDDVDGGAATETVRLGLDDVFYELDVWQTSKTVCILSAHAS